MEINAIEERTADTLAVTLDGRWAASAGTFGVPVESAGTGVHGGDQHEARWEGDTAGGA